MSRFYSAQVFIDDKFFRNVLLASSSLSDAKAKFDNLFMHSHHTIENVNIVRDYIEDGFVSSKWPVMIVTDGAGGIELAGLKGGRMNVR